MNNSWSLYIVYMHLIFSAEISYLAAKLYFAGFCSSFRRNVYFDRSCICWAADQVCFVLWVVDLCCLEIARQHVILISVCWSLWKSFSVDASSTKLWILVERQETSFWHYSFFPVVHNTPTLLHIALQFLFPIVDPHVRLSRTDEITWMTLSFIHVGCE